MKTYLIKSTALIGGGPAHIFSDCIKANDEIEAVKKWDDEINIKFAHGLATLSTVEELKTIAD